MQSGIVIIAGKFFNKFQRAKQQIDKLKSFLVQI